MYTVVEEQLYKCAGLDVLLETTYVFKVSCTSSPSTLIYLFYKELYTFNYMTLLRHVSCVKLWLFWFYAVKVWFDSLMRSIADCNMQECAV
jgi:hypothetical protein